MDRKEYSRRLEFEHELINHRITWLLTSQTILFTAYGVALGKSYETGVGRFLKIIAFIGPTISVCILVGIVAAFLAKLFAWVTFKGDGNSGEQFGVRTWITVLGLLPKLCYP